MTCFPGHAPSVPPWPHSGLCPPPLTGSSPLREPFPGWPDLVLPMVELQLLPGNYYEFLTLCAPTTPVRVVRECPGLTSFPAWPLNRPGVCSSWIRAGHSATLRVSAPAAQAPEGLEVSKLASHAPSSGPGCQGGARCTQPSPSAEPHAAERLWGCPRCPFPLPGSLLTAPLPCEPRRTGTEFLLQLLLRIS